MGSTWGNRIKLSLFGESHGEGIGIVIDSLPAGIELDMNYIRQQMARRAPGNSSLATPRKEDDEVKILSGIFEGKTTGAPLCGVIYNNNIRSKDYSILKDTLRPSHSDYPAKVKYLGFNDYRGGGHFSGRITAPLMFAGAIAMQMLQEKNIVIGSRIKSIHKTSDVRIDYSNINETLLKKLKEMAFPTLSEDISNAMEDEIIYAKNSGDSVGGVVETYIINVPAGLGQPFFHSLESQIAQIVFSIPAVKGIEFGEGFDIAMCKGSETNDPYTLENGKIICTQNSNGGILGGISNSMPIVFRTAIKPTPSISLQQDTVNILDMKNTKLKIEGRHDPCIVPRALPVIEAAAALVLLDNTLEREGEVWKN